MSRTDDPRETHAGHIAEPIDTEDGQAPWPEDNWPGPEMPAAPPAQPDTDDVYQAAARASVLKDVEIMGVPLPDQMIDAATNRLTADPRHRAAVDAARRAERALIADELLSWAWEADEPIKRQLRAASLRIAPEPTEDEMREALADLLGGMKGRKDA